MVLNFIHDAYHDQTGKLVVPKSLSMKKDMSNNREINELKAYRTKNRYNLGNTLWLYFFSFNCQLLIEFFFLNTFEGISSTVKIALIF